MKKIAILAFSDKHGGGVYQYTQSIIDALKEDKEGKYVVFCNTTDKTFDNSGLEVRKIDKIQSNFFQKSILVFQFLFFIRKSFFFKKNEFLIFKDIDLFISPAISAYPHFYLNKPFILTLHDMQERYYPEFFSFYEKFTRWVNNITLAKSATKIICESNYVKNDIIKFIGINEKKITVMQSPPPENFLNFKFDNIKFQEVRQKYNLPENYLFYPAQFWFHKNHINLIEAFELVTKKNDDVFLVLTGSKQNNYINLMKKVNELNINSKIKYLGYIDYEDMPYIYKMSKMLVMPTLFESVSIPIYEAFALGVPVCSSNVVALPEQVGDAGLIFNPHDKKDMANKIMMYLQNEELRSLKLKLGLKKVKNFNHEEYRKKLLEVINVTKDIR